MSVYDPGAGVIWTPEPGNDPWKATGKRVTVQEPQFLVVSVDIGFLNDRTVISVIDTHAEITEHFTPGRFEPTRTGKEVVLYHTLLAQHSPRLGTETPELLRQVAAIAGSLPYRPLPATIVWDATGLGLSVLQTARAMGLKPSVGITITSGNAASLTGSDWRVAKQQLCAALHHAMVYNRLTIANFEGREELANEMSAFTATMSSSGNALFEAAAGQHDDRVMSLAAGLFFAANKPKPPRVFSLLTGEEKSIH